MKKAFREYLKAKSQHGNPAAKGTAPRVKAEAPILVGLDVGQGPDVERYTVAAWKPTADPTGWVKTPFRPSHLATYMADIQKQFDQQFAALYGAWPAPPAGQAACPECGGEMVHLTGGYRCLACGHQTYEPDVQLPPSENWRPAPELPKRDSFYSLGY